SLKITNPNSPQYTWSNNNSKSRIDQIWISHNFAHDLAHTKTVDYTSIFSTDHKLIWCDLIRDVKQSQKTSGLMVCPWTGLVFSQKRPTGSLAVFIM
ncbi:4434_t:CDS:1, partial [Entrophospora sp. SA101]